MKMRQKTIQTFMLEQEVMPLEKCRNEIDFQIYAAEQLIKAIFKMYDDNDLDNYELYDIEPDLDVKNYWAGLDAESLLDLLRRNGLALTHEKTDETDDAYWKMRSTTTGIKISDAQYFIGDVEVSRDQFFESW